MEQTGTITAVLPIQTGESTKGQWSKQTAVLTYGTEHPKQMAFDMFGDKIKPLKIGDTVTIKFDVESREYNGKWYTNVSAWAVEVTGTEKPAPKEKLTEPDKYASAPQTVDDSLPF